MSYIDREQVINMFQNLAHDDWNQGASTSWANAYDCVVELLVLQPDADLKVLTFARNKYDGSWFMDISSWTGVKNHDEYHFWGYGDSMKITHWMPLPEPPKEE